MTGTALLLAPGAGASRDQSTLVAIEEGLRPMPVARMDFPYRKAGRKSPDRPAVLIASVREAAADLAARAEVAPSRVLLGGRSMGGRMCSMAVGDADDPLAALGLVLISYPLHPPGKPDQMRTDHFPCLTVPCLFVSGTRDAFGSPDELEQATALIPGRVTHVWLEGGNHGLRGRDGEVVDAVKAWLGLASEARRRA